MLCPYCKNYFECVCPIHFIYIYTYTHVYIYMRDMSIFISALG